MPSLSRHTVTNLTLLLILLVATGMRVIGFVDQSPPGIEHDEVANWQIDRAILDGQHAVYFTQAYGHEAGFHYWQTLFVALLGDNLFAIRLSAALVGVMVVALTYAINRRFFGREVGMIAAAITAVLLFPVFYSRLGLRAISLPLMAGFALMFWWQAWHGPSGRSRLWLFGFSGLLAGLTMYTYLASRALPIFFVLLYIYLLITRWSTLKDRLNGSGVFALVYAATAWPLFRFLQQTPDAETRVAEVDAPLQAFFAGDVGPLLQNSWKIIQMFGFNGDPLWRQNIANEPVFGLILAILFYAGIVIALFKWHDLRFSILLIWLAASVVPSAVTINAPSSIRIIMILPFLAAVPAITIATVGEFLSFRIKDKGETPARTTVPGHSQFLHRSEGLSTLFPQLSTGKWEYWGINLLTLGILTFYSQLTFGMLFTQWAQNDEIRFVWQAAFTQMAEYLDENPNISHVAVGGWTPESMDHPTMQLLLKREDLALRHFGQVGEIQTVVVPAASDQSQLVHVLRPTALPLNVYLERHLITHDRPAIISETGEFTVYQTQPADIRPLTPATAEFGNEIEFIGHEILLTPDLNQLELVTYWRVIKTPAEPRRLFLHMVDKNGVMLGQHDGLNAPAEFWQSGDLILQYHVLPQLNVPYDLRLGVYTPSPPYKRLITADNQDFILLTSSGE